jgi:hypothetical protein
LDSSGTNEIVLPNALVTEDMPGRWLVQDVPGVDYFDSGMAQFPGKPGRSFSLNAVGVGYHAKYHLEQISYDSAPVKFRDHVIMYDSGGDTGTAAIKVVMMNPHFEVGGASTDTAVWAFKCSLIEVI